MSDHNINMPDYDTNKACLRKLIDRLARDSDYNNAPRILRRDLLVIFLYLDERPLPQRKFKEMEDEESELSDVEKIDTKGQEKGDQRTEHLGGERSVAGSKAGSKEEDEGEGQREYGNVRLYETDGADRTHRNTSWTDWYELITRIAATFPYYMGTFKPLRHPDASSDHQSGWLEPWTDAFSSYEAPFQRHVTLERRQSQLHPGLGHRQSMAISRRMRRSAHVIYRVNKNDAARYLRGRGHLPSLSPDTSLTPSKSFCDLPVELRVHIWKLLLTYPDSGVQYEYYDDNEKHRMYTISRDLHSQVSLGRFLGVRWKLDHLKGDDQIVPGVKRSKHHTQSLYKVFAPKTINKTLRKDAEQVFLENNLFVFTSLDDLHAFLHDGLLNRVRPGVQPPPSGGLSDAMKAKRQFLRRIALACKPGSVFYEGADVVYESLTECSGLREIHFYCSSMNHRPRKGVKREPFKILARHPKLLAIYCSGNEANKSPQQKAASYISQILYQEGSKCKTYCDGVLFDTATAGQTSEMT